MKHLLTKIESIQWAITEVALDAIWNIASRDWTEAEYDIFHRVSADMKQAIVAQLGEPVDDSQTAFVKEGNGFLLFDGPIIPQATAFSAMSGLVSLDQMTESFKAFESDASIKHIVGLFDTPGGAVTGTGDFAIMVTESKKPTVGFVYGQASSAGYWIGSAFNKLYASSTGLVGSIGVLTKIRNQDNPSQTVIVSSQSPQKRPDLQTPKGRESVQQVLDELADVFVSAVAKGRGVSTETVLEQFGQGGEVVAARALSVGMIDGITTLDHLVSSFHRPPAMGGDTRRRSMDLEQFLAENPAAKDQLKRLLVAECERGRIAAVTAADEKAAEDKKAREATLDRASKFLTGHGDSITQLAVRVIRQDASIDALEAAVATGDQQSEEIASLRAQIESQGLGGTPPPQEPTPEQEEVASANRIRKSLGMLKVGE